MRQRIALLGDLHANVWALEAVLADVRKQGVDLLLNLGDILHGPLMPRATYDLLRSTDIALTIRGNQDRDLIEAAGQERTARRQEAWMLGDLGPEAIEWLRSLPETAEFDGEVLLCHGSPGDDLCYLLEDVTNGHPVVRAESEIVRLLKDAAQPMIVCGHTHIPRLVRLTNGQTIVNPGSVGLPAYSDAQPVPYAMEAYSPYASYAILEKKAAGWDATFRKVPYDTREASRTAAELGRADWAHQIATGRVATS
ncbi:MAG: metallophosphoesterase family protein [Acidobacteriota bacterium]